MADLSMKTAKNRFYELGETIRELEIKTDEFVKTVKFIEVQYPTQKEWINFYRANVTLNLIYLDFCAALRLYLAGQTNYEERFATKNLHVIIKEGYKRIYGFTDKERNKGVWRHDIRPIASLITNLEDEASKIDNYLALFEDDLITKYNYSDKTTERDLAVHYNDDCIRTHKYLSDLNADNTVISCTHFLELMNVIRKFCYLGISQQRTSVS